MSEENLRFDAALFDMDGTILTSIPAVERAWSAWAGRVGASVGAIMAYMHGRTALDTITRFAPAGADLAAEVRWLESRELEDLVGIAPIPGARDLLLSLPADRWGVVTSASRALAVRRIAAAGLPTPPFLISCQDVRRGKPDPEGYLMAAALLGCPADRCLVFEDTAAGLRAGRAAGAQVIRVLGTPGQSEIDPLAAISTYAEIELIPGPMGLELKLGAA